MTAKTEPSSGLSYGWALGEDNWNTGMDTNLVKIGSILNINVEDFVASPTVTTNGTRYLITTGSGAFVGQDGKLAVRVDGNWIFYSLPEGCIVYRKSNTSHYKRESGSNVLIVDLSLYLTASTASSTYQTQAGMSAYLTASTAASTYQSQSGMSRYLTTSTASSTYATIANQRYTFVTDSSSTTYTLLASSVTENGRVVVELTNSSLTNITVATTTGSGKTVGDSINVCIGVYTAQTLVQGAGTTLLGTLAFSGDNQTKTLIYKGSNTWRVIG
jgi:hypothetical protein